MRLGSPYQEDLEVTEHFTRVTRKGQITVPVQVRRALGLSEGDHVAVTLQDGTVKLERRRNTVERTAGVLNSSRPALSPAQERAEFELGVATEAEESLNR